MNLIENRDVPTQAPVLTFSEPDGEPGRAHAVRRHHVVHLVRVTRDVADSETHVHATRLSIHLQAD